MAPGDSASPAGNESLRQAQDSSRAMPTGETLPRSLLLKRSSEIREILARGRKHTGNHLVLYCKASDKLSLRVGFLTPKRLGNAVKRNRVRRWMREAFRRRRARMVSSQQILLMGRSSAVNATYQAVNDDLIRLCQQARLLK